jgi:hypothetical protein
LEKILNPETIISISGGAGTGKTSFAQFLVGNILTSNSFYNGSCLWVQASELFSHRRLSQLFVNDRLAYLKEKIYLYPHGKVLDAYDDLLNAISHLIDKDTILPPDLQFIVIDNISHHLRYKISQVQDISKVVATQDAFYDDLLLPLILYCQRTKIRLLLIHENTYVPKLGKNKPFFYKLYERISHPQLILGKSIITSTRSLLVQFETSSFELEFKLLDRGFLWLVD